MDDEEQKAASALGGLITSAMIRAIDEKRDIYIWERKALQWLIRFRDRRPHGHMGNDLVKSFLEPNREVILSPDGRMDFNLRAADLAKQVQP